MNDRLRMMLNLEDALSRLSGSNLYSAALDLFTVFGYSIDPLDTCINETMLGFVYGASSKRWILGVGENEAIRGAESVSWLFTLTDGSNDLGFVPQRKTIDQKNAKANFFCVGLSCSLHDRSVVAFDLTQVIAKIMDTPIVVLFRHNNVLMVSCLPCVLNGSRQLGQIYLSDWYSFDPIDEDILFRLSNWQVGNFCNNSISAFLADFVYMMARPYFFTDGSDEYLSRKPNVLIPYDYYLADEVVSIDGVRYTCPVELVSNSRGGFRGCYGYDYVVNGDWYVENVNDDSDWVFQELLELEDMSDSAGDSGNQWDDEDLFDMDTEGPDLDDLVDIGNIPDDAFEDPLKMLDFLASQVCEK